MLSEARSSSDFIIDRAIALNGNRTPRSQKAVITQLLPLYQAMTNSVAKNRFRKELADRLGLNESVVDQEMRAHSQAHAQEAATNAIGINLMHSPRWKLLHLLINRPELIAEARSYISADIFTDGEASDLFSLMLDFYDAHGNLDGIMDAAQDPETQKLLSSMLASPALEEDLQPELVQQIIRLHKIFLRSRIRANRILLTSEKNAGRKSNLLLQIQNDMKQCHDLDAGE